jgi:hypothetical protein
MPLTNGSGFGDTGPPIFVIDLQVANKSFSAYYFLKVHLHNFSKIKMSKRSNKRDPKTYRSNGSGFGSGSATLHGTTAIII